MKLLKSNLGLRFTLIVSLFLHILCFKNIEFTFGKKAAGEGAEFSKIFFLGPILQQADYNFPPTKDTDYSLNKSHTKDMLTRLERSTLISRGFLAGLRLESAPSYELGPRFKKPPLVNLVDNKVIYLEALSLPLKKAESSIMFNPPMPYHFLLYFKDQHTAHMEISFYISSKGKIAGIRRKISSGNPEVDLLVMRNFTHFLNLCKSNFGLDFWQTVKIDLSR